MSDLMFWGPASEHGTPKGPGVQDSGRTTCKRRGKGGPWNDAIVPAVQAQ